MDLEHMGMSPMTHMKAFKKALHEAHEELAMYQAKGAPISHRGERWNPYSFEEGTCAAVAGPDFVILAGDTRMSAFDGICPISRNTEKVHLLSNSVAMCTAGFHGDILELERLLKARMARYKFDYRQPMSVDLVAEMLSRNLYYRRFFPYLTGVVLAGITEKGTGAVFSYDPIGCIENVPYNVSGSATAMIEPFFDAQLGFATQDKAHQPQVELTLERAISLVKDAFRSATERQIATGDSLTLTILKANSEPQIVTIPLRED